MKLNRDDKGPRRVKIYKEMFLKKEEGEISVYAT